MQFGTVFLLLASVSFVAGAISGVSMAIGASFQQSAKSSNGACQSALGFRSLSLNQPHKIDRLKLLLVQSKELAEIEQVAGLAASTVIRMSADYGPLRSLAAGPPNNEIKHGYGSVLHSTLG